MKKRRIEKARADQVKAELIRLVGTGAEIIPGALAKHYFDIDRVTLWRWLDKARLAVGAMGAEVAVAAATQAAELGAARAAASPGALAAHAVGNRLPRPVDPNSISALGNVGAIGLVHECIGHARQVLNHCQNESGKITNYKGFLQASNHMRASIDTLARVAERMNDAAKINQIQAAIMDEIRAASPEVAERIVQRIEAIIADWGY